MIKHNEQIKKVKEIYQDKQILEEKNTLEFVREKDIEKRNLENNETMPIGMLRENNMQDLNERLLKNEQDNNYQESVHKAALKKDKKKLRADKVRHSFYKFVKVFVDIGRWISGKSREAKNVKENSLYNQNLQMAYDRLYAMRLEAEENNTLDSFYENYGNYYEEVKAKYDEIEQEINNNYKIEERQEKLVEKLQSTNAPMKFGNNQQANVVGGTKPASVQYSQDGSKWLIKENLSCIGMDAPNAAIVTEAGYKVQKLVFPETAIEAFKGKSIGKGVVSYQKMVAGVKNDLDLFRFSRTPDAMTKEELKRIEKLAPQILREHTTDWLLCNYDTKGENFIIANDGTGEDRVYGIDKEASFRAILDKGAQHMSKDYQKFDQDTVYNQMFRLYAQGKMDFDLHVIEEQIKRVETLNEKQVDGNTEYDTVHGDQVYMEMFEEYIEQQKKDRPDKVPEIKRNILRRKQNLRKEYREFLGNLVRERIKNTESEEEKQKLRDTYFGGLENGVFLFKSDTVETIQKEREMEQLQKEEDKELLEEKVKEADKKDEKKYNRRHRIYDFSKAFIMGAKKFFGLFKNKKKMKEMRSTTVQTEAGEQTIEMTRSEEIFLGGTKPMSQYIASDDSKWLAKQAVNCMGYYKIEGVLLTEAGANLQKVVHPETAVDAFAGRTKQHGDVSFQRRLSNVEGGPNKLDLFKFSKHPELATVNTIKQVEELGPQILREHTTDWLLCNFDTKGENFIITKEEDGPRVLHGIDKEAAFNKILHPDAQSMSRTYKPHANDTLYNVVYSMYANCQMDLDLYSVIPQIEKVQSLSDEEYMDLYKDYLDHVKQKKKDKYNAIYENILARKKGLKAEYARFFTELIEERCKKLHPEEALALRNKYYGAGGKSFQFP